MIVNNWDLKTKKFIGFHELQDTNLIGADFTDATFHITEDSVEG